MMTQQTDLPTQQQIAKLRRAAKSLREGGKDAEWLNPEYRDEFAVLGEKMLASEKRAISCRKLKVRAELCVLTLHYLSISFGRRTRGTFPGGVSIAYAMWQACK
jgi:hypothetical protein